MNNRLYISLVLILLLLEACNKQNIDITPGILYNVTTTEGDGFAVFEHTQNDKWHGIYYLEKGRLMAEAQIVELQLGSELSLIDSRGRKIPIVSYSLYKAPEFEDYPETWTYKDSIYAVTVMKDSVYGKAQGYWVSYPDSGGTYDEIFDAKREVLKNGKKELELTLDVYIPNDSKSASRPLLVLIHGGAFFNGDKADDGFPEWSKYFAGLGYVVASVNYRLGFRKDPLSIKKAGYRAVQDVDAAIRYLISKKEEYAIDPQRVFIAGTSAGGITALNVAFMTNQDILSGVEKDSMAVVNSETLKPYSILAVGNMWGAVNDISILNNAASAVISFHNTGDPVVPFGKGHPFESVFFNWVIFPTMYGSGQITEYLGQKRATLKPYDLSNKHTLHIDKDETGKNKLNARFYEIETNMRDFFSSVMQPSPIIYEHRTGSQTFQISSSDIDSAFWFIEGGAILKQTDYRVNVLLFPDATHHSVMVCGKYKSGLTFRNKWNL